MIANRFKPAQRMQDVEMPPPVVAVVPTTRREPSVPSGVARGLYRASAPLIRPSKLTSRERGGVGKDLSEGWCLNFAVGCTHACPFCYVDAIHKRFGARYGEITKLRWGDYFLVPWNLDEVIDKTPWGRWEGKEVMMSSTHDPYLPTLSAAARRILERALPAGVRFCIQTRSVLVLNDLDVLCRYRDQIRLQVSISTMDGELSRRTEPRVPSPARRLEVMAKASSEGLRVGVIIAPVFPECSVRPDVQGDLRAISESLQEIHPDHIYGESLHVRGENLRLVEAAIGERLCLADGFDRRMGELFHSELQRVGLRGIWWPEH